MTKRAVKLISIFALTIILMMAFSAAVFAEEVQTPEETINPAEEIIDCSEQINNADDKEEIDPLNIQPDNYDAEPSGEDNDEKEDIEVVPVLEEAKVPEAEEEQNNTQSVPEESAKPACDEYTLKFSISGIDDSTCEFFGGSEEGISVLDVLKRLGVELSDSSEIGFVEESVDTDVIGMKQTENGLFITDKGKFEKASRPLVLTVDGQEISLDITDDEYKRIYVGSNGTNNGDGTQAKPFLYMSSAISAADGNTIITLSADYSGGYIDVEYKNIKLDLNGKALSLQGSAIMVYGGCTFTLYDMAGGGRICGGGGRMSGSYWDKVGGAVYVKSKGTFIMESGVISGNHAQVYGGAVYVEGGGTFEMHGGKITDNYVNNGDGGGVCLDSGNAKFTMTGGEISNCRSRNGGGIMLRGNASAVISAGKIYGNYTSTGNGGGIFVTNGTLTISGGEIYSNNGNFGGGIYSDGSITMTGGKIYGNSAKGAGGGICITQPSITLSDMEIFGNTAGKSGGGIFVSSGTTKMLSGEIHDNTSSQGDNSDELRIGSGTATISGGKIKKSLSVGNSTLLFINGGQYGWFADHLNDTDDKIYIARGFMAESCEDGDYKSRVVKDPNYNAVYVGNNGTDEDGFGTEENPYKTISYAMSKAGEGTTIVLLTNITEDITVESGKTAKIDINSKIWSGTGTSSTITVSGNLTVMDSAAVFTEASKQGKIIKGKGSVYNDKNVGGGVLVLNGGLFILDTGRIMENTATNNGGGVFVANGGTFTMIGGYVSSNKVTGSSDGNGGAGVYVDNGGIFNFNGGEISSNTSEAFGGGLMVNDSSFTMSVGSILNNTSKRGGGGIYICPGHTFNMVGGKISGNSATGSGNAGGGAIYIASNSTFDLSGGELSGNNGENGGAVNFAGTVFTMTGGTISGNKGIYFGGGVYIANGSSFTLKSGTISSNITTQLYGAGIYLAKNTVFIMDGGEVVSNTAPNSVGKTGDGGGICSDGISVTINGGRIANNYAPGYAGGIYLTSKCLLTMNGGEISGNHTFMGNGGGVFVTDGSTFILNGGKIIGNYTTSHGIGGGVFFTRDCIFKMTGGEISGNSASDGSAIAFLGSTNSDTFSIEDGLISGSIFVQSKFGGIKGGKFSYSASTLENSGWLYDARTAVSTNDGTVYISTVKGIVYSSDTEKCYNKVSDALSKGEVNLIINKNISDSFVVDSGKTVKIDMNGHTISGTGEGSVITVKGNLEMSSSSENGKITGGRGTFNEADEKYYGGGVYIASTAALTLNNIEVSSNTADVGGGTYAESGAGCTLVGKTKIINNTTPDGESKNNLYLLNNEKIISNLLSGAEIHVCTEIEPEKGMSDTAVTGANAEDMHLYFRSDHFYGCFENGDSNTVVLRFAVAADGNNKYSTVQNAIDSNKSATVVMLTDTNENINVASGKTIKLDLNGHVLRGTSVLVQGSLTTTDTSEQLTENMTGEICGDIIANGGYAALDGGRYDGYLKSENGGTVAVFSGLYAKTVDESIVDPGSELVKNLDRKTMGKYPQAVYKIGFVPDFPPLEDNITTYMDDCFATVEIDGTRAIIKFRNSEGIPLYPNTIKIVNIDELLMRGAKTLEVNLSYRLVLSMDLVSAMDGDSNSELVIDYVSKVIYLARNGKVVFSFDIEDIFNIVAKAEYDGQSVKAYDKMGKLIKEYVIE